MQKSQDFPEIKLKAGMTLQQERYDFEASASGWEGIGALVVIIVALALLGAFALTRVGLLRFRRG